MMSLLIIERSLLFALSFLALSCLIVDHLLCPDWKDDELLNQRVPVVTVVRRSEGLTSDGASDCRGDRNRNP